MTVTEKTHPALLDLCSVSELASRVGGTAEALSLLAAAQVPVVGGFFKPSLLDRALTPRADAITAVDSASPALAVLVPALAILTLALRDVRFGKRTTGVLTSTGSGPSVGYLRGQLVGLDRSGAGEDDDTADAFEHLHENPWRAITDAHPMSVRIFVAQRFSKGTAQFTVGDVTSINEDLCFFVELERRSVWVRDTKDIREVRETLLSGSSVRYAYALKGTASIRFAFPSHETGFELKHRFVHSCD